jgi:hypothetical protein
MLPSNEMGIVTVAWLLTGRRNNFSTDLFGF